MPAINPGDLHLQDLAVLRAIVSADRGLTADEIEAVYFQGFEQHRAEFADGSLLKGRLGGLLLKGRFVAAQNDGKYVATEYGAQALATVTQRA